MKTIAHSSVLATAIAATRFKGSLVAVSHAWLACSLLAAGLHAAACDRIYYLQSASYMILTGPTTAAVALTSKTTVQKDMAGVEVIHPETQYDLVTRFEGNGACSEWKKTKVDFAQRKKGSNNFSQVTTDNNYIKLHATPYPFAAGVDFEYWFGFASSLRGDTAVVFEAIGKLRNGGPLPHVYYAAATMTRNIKEIGPGGAVIPKGTRTHYFESLASHPDSAALIKGLLDPWKDYKDNDTQTVSFKVQLFKALYDSTQPPVGVRGVARSKSTGFQATQSGGTVLIRPADGKASDEALGLFNMLGHKVATLHPTGYLYQWNGRTASGAQAQTGVYFVQSGSRVLGKFFYSH